jgi:Flp pilus assembly protein TadD
MQLVAVIALVSGCATSRPVAGPGTAASTPPITPPSTAAPPGPVAAPSPVAVSSPPPPVDAAEAKLEQARALLGRGDTTAAISVLREVLRLAPDSTQARAALGRALYALGDVDGAVEELRALLRAQPELSEPRLTLAATLVARQEWPAARVELDEALRRQPDLVQAYYTLGIVRYAQGDLPGAIDAYRRLLASEPGAHDARYNLALVLKLARRDAEAAPEFLAAAQAGLPRAEYFTGAAYAAGAGVERDLVAAITWWSRAARHGVAPADEALAQLRQAALGKSRRPPAERAAIELAFTEYRARIAQEYPDVPREGDEPVGAALLRQGRGNEAVGVLIREAAALSEPALRLLESIAEPGVEGQVPARDARIAAYLTTAAAEGRLRPRARP